jgi:ribonucleoside-diphosphate reductase alpha chain
VANFSSYAEAILQARYLKKDKLGNPIETPNQMLERVAKHVSKAETSETLQREMEQKFISIMDSLEFLPNSPTLMNAGRELGQLSACFLLPIQDNLSNIFEMVKQVALIHKTGGGTGIVLSHLRPSGARVQSTAGVASGPISFMRVFDVATDVVKQGGVRRGANMGILHCTHPDILNFIVCKSDMTSFQNFNISVGITDEFFRVGLKGNGFTLKDPLTKEKSHIDAGAMFELLCHQAWLNGDPGIVFLDSINAKNPTPWLGQIEGTNPCGEQPLLPYESCNLGSIDVSKFVVNKKIDWDRLDEVTEIAVRFLDDVIDVNNFPNVKIQRKTKLTRKIGLGIMGWADALIALGIRYDSDPALKLAERLMARIRETAHMTSRNLGQEKGTCFPQLKRRNSTLTTIAPTGTLSILAGCSSSIEPVFAKSYTKTVLGDLKMELGAKYTEVDDSLMVTALDIPVEAHIKMQSAFQRYTDNAVSKTINLPNSATVDDVKKAFTLAHELGCKGITVYRDGSRKAPLEATTEGELSECEDGKCKI